MGEVAFSPSFDRFEDGAGRELVQLGHRPARLLSA